MIDIAAAHVTRIKGLLASPGPAATEFGLVPSESDDLVEFLPHLGAGHAQNRAIEKNIFPARQLGMKPGTGGSEGIGYLKTTLDKKFFPELWESRTYLDIAHGERGCPFAH